MISNFPYCIDSGDKLVLVLLSSSTCAIFIILVMMFKTALLFNSVGKNFKYYHSNEAGKKFFSVFVLFCYKKWFM